jgi:hypothetical protein
VIAKRSAFSVTMMTKPSTNRRAHEFTSSDVESFRGSDDGGSYGFDIAITTNVFSDRTLPFTGPRRTTMI